MWLYQNKEFLEDMIGRYYGFVYCIENLITRRRYIGKKFFYSSRTKIVKGRKKRYKIFSDWKTYHGSNGELKTDVETLGANNFRREILRLCKTKTECAYYEGKEQFSRGVLESDEYYNGWIMCRIRKRNWKQN